MNTYFDELVNLTADKWNVKVANSFGCSVDELKTNTSISGLRHIGDRIKIQIYNNTILSGVDSNNIIDELNTILSDKGNSLIYEPTKLDKYRIRINEKGSVIESIALTGKIIVGCDFTNSDLNNSYFCGCTFYNCIFNNVNLTYSVINACIFNSCTLNKCDFTSSTIARTRFYECNIEYSTHDYVNISDCVYIACSMSDDSIIQSKILYTSFSECILTHSDFKDTDLIQCIFTNTNLKTSDFKRSSMVDCMLVRCDLSACEFNSFSITCTSNSLCKIDDINKSIFQMNHSLYSPSLFEWESEDV